MSSPNARFIHCDEAQPSLLKLYYTCRGRFPRDQGLIIKAAMQIKKPCPLKAYSLNTRHIKTLTGRILKTKHFETKQVTDHTENCAKLWINPTLLNPHFCSQQLLGALPGFC